MNTFLVVLYNTKLNDALTLNALDIIAYKCIKALELVRNSRLIVWNNGPQTIKSQVVTPLINRLNQSFAQLEVLECLGNMPLAHLYNLFTEGEGLLVLLDQDTELSSSYFEDLAKFVESDAQVYVPKISVQGKVVYPRIGKLPVRETFYGVHKVEEFCAITSGLAIKAEVLKRLKNEYGDIFDTRFALYGVDSSFFYRLKQMQLRNYYIGHKIVHGLSRVAERRPNDDRVVERLIDLMLQFRNYPSWMVLKVLIRALISTPAISLMFAPKLAKAYLIRRHWRTADGSTLRGEKLR